MEPTALAHASCGERTATAKVSFLLMWGLPTADSHAVCPKCMHMFQESMASAATLECSAMTNMVSAWTVVLSSSLVDSARAIFFLHLVAIIDPRSKVESDRHAGQAKQPKQCRQWTGDIIVSPSSQSIIWRLLMLVLYSFNDGNALQHDNIFFRQSDNITVGGLYFS